MLSKNSLEKAFYSTSNSKSLIDNLIYKLNDIFKFTIYGNGPMRSKEQ
jgi:hypothetical protein